MQDESPQINPGFNRRMLLRGGLAAGLGVAAVGVASTALTGVAQAATTPRAARPVVRLGKAGITPDTSSNPAQNNWDYCANCAGLWYSANGTDGVCPATTTGHVDNPSDNYEVWYNFSGATGNPLDPQPDWSWCKKCQGLFFGTNVSESACPAGGNHNRGTRNYSLPFDATGDVQSGWCHCTNCQGVFYAGTGSSAGVCPATHRVHDGVGSYPYDMIIWSS
jgi:hypothetical protein